MGKKIDFEEFKRRAEHVHGLKFSYNKDSFKNWLDYIEIYCPLHGTFQQKARLHVEQKWECRQCGQQKQKESKRISVEEFICRAHEIHGSNFCYNKMKGYKSITTNVSIFCSKHGYFDIKAGNHLQFRTYGGCEHCKIEGLQQDRFSKFLNSSKQKYPDLFSYENTEYGKCGELIKLNCVTHGEIKISPIDHLRVGCFKCRNKKEDLWLTEMNIPFDKEHRQVRVHLSSGLKIVDGFDPSTNTVYLFHGDYWHGNLQIYHPDYFNAKVGKTAETLYNETLDYESELRAAGFSVISIWENQWIPSVYA